MIPINQFRLRSTVTRAFIGLSVASGCHETRVPTAPTHRALEKTGGSRADLIFDGRALNGVTGFYFRPPILPTLDYVGQFDPGLSPVVEVCEWNASTSACGITVARFPRTDGGGPAAGLDVTGQQYHVNWKVDECLWGLCTLDPAQTYRIRVLVNDFELGFADVHIVAKGEAKNKQTGEFILLTDDQGLSIKFRAEVEIVGRVAIEHDGLLDLEFAEIRRLRPIIWDLHDDPIPGAAANWSLSFGGSSGSGGGGSGPTIGADGSLSAGIGAGSGSVTLSYGGRSASVTFRVLVPVHSIAFASPFTTLAIGITTPLLAMPFDAEGNPLPGRTVVYGSSDPSVATVDPSTGVVTGVTAGVATITASSGGQTGSSQTFVYNGSGAGGLGLTGPGDSGGGGFGGTLVIGGMIELTATFNVINVPISNLTGYVLWNTSNPSVASVSAGGVLTAVGSGSATITANFGALTGSLTVTVPPQGPVTVTRDLSSVCMSTPNQYYPNGAVTSCFSLRIVTTPLTGGRTQVALAVANLEGIHPNDNTWFEGGSGTSVKLTYPEGVARTRSVLATTPFATTEGGMILTSFFTDAELFNSFAHDQTQALSSSQTFAVSGCSNFARSITTTYFHNAFCAPNSFGVFTWEEDGVFNADELSAYVEVYYYSRVAPSYPSPVNMFCTFAPNSSILASCGRSAQ